MSIALLSLVWSTFFGRLVVFAGGVVMDIVVEDASGVPDVVNVDVGSVVVVGTSDVNVTGIMTSGRFDVVNSLSRASTCIISLLTFNCINGTEVLGMGVRSFTIRTDGDVMVGPDVGTT